ncbi:MAG: hypothetical protein ACKVQS_08665 [Fimbriimonadaceae bacterium]
MKRISLFLVIIAGLLIAGCSSTTPEAKSDTTTKEPTAVTKTDPTSSEPVAFRNGKGELVCPMMGSVIKDEASAVGHVDYEGVRYYLCCDMCIEPANKDPKAMAEKAAKLK